MLIFLQDLSLETFPISKGQGIVYTCNSNSAKSVLISISFLRHYGCKLPVEIWHLDELSIEIIMRFESLKNVKVKTLTKFNYNRRNGEKLFIAKAASIYLSNFEKVLFLDSDNYPAQDPTFLFKGVQFLEYGALFWKDYWKTHPDDPIWKFLNLTVVDGKPFFKLEYEFESGQILVDKSREDVMKALRLSLYMQENADFFYDLVN
jgi:alpha 1,2-mannosyltransferase